MDWSQSKDKGNGAKYWEVNKSISETGVALRELGGPDTSSKELDEYGVQLESFMYHSENFMEQY